MQCLRLSENRVGSDRVIVISEGKFVYESAIATADYRLIGQRMAGH
ncbi:MAG: hypothetical protein WBB01_09935 [Phormidesmis sp.]